MEIQDILKWTDEQLLIKTGKHLDSLQKAILEGVGSHQDYKEIALNHQRSYAHVKKEAWKLWKLLSDTIGEDIQKSNVYSVLEKAKFSNVSNSFDCVQIGVGHGNINICSDDKRAQSSPETSQTQNHSTITNLTNAPALTEYYPRTTEETTLKNWILNTTTSLITIYGLNGIGKSTLTLQLIQEIQTEFDYIIWQSLNDKPTLTTLQTNLKQIFSQTQKTPLPTVLDYFRTYRCLIIIDDLQNIFKTREIAGQYLPEYEDYSQFFKQIATTNHQTCLILLTSEKPREITALEDESPSTQTLYLKGLLEEQAQQILRKKQLNDEEKWPQLIALYQNHPLWLKIISATINQLFNGSVSQYLCDPNDIYLGDIEPILETQLQRLSESEKTIMGWLANQTKPLHISQTLTETTLSKSQYWQAIQSLIRRSIVEKEEVEKRAMFQINPIFKQYIQSNSNFLNEN